MKNRFVLFVLCIYILSVSASIRQSIAAPRIYYGEDIDNDDAKVTTTRTHGLTITLTNCEDGYQGVCGYWNINMTVDAVSSHLGDTVNCYGKLQYYGSSYDVHTFSYYPKLDMDLELWTQLTCNDVLSKRFTLSCSSGTIVLQHATLSPESLPVIVMTEKCPRGCSYGQKCYAGECISATDYRNDYICNFQTEKNCCGNEKKCCESNLYCSTDSDSNEICDSYYRGSDTSDSGSSPSFYIGTIWYIIGPLFAVFVIIGIIIAALKRRRATENGTAFVALQELAPTTVVEEVVTTTNTSQYTPPAPLVYATVPQPQYVYTTTTTSAYVPNVEVGMPSQVTSVPIGMAPDPFSS